MSTSAVALVLCASLATLCGCSTSANRADAGPYINPKCPVSFSPGCCGSTFDGGECPCAPFTCEPIPSECENDLTCDCIGATPSTCQTQSIECSYDAGTFTVGCDNP